MNVSSLDLMNYKPGILISGVREWTTLASSGVFNVLIQIYCILYWFTRHPNWNNNRANWRVSSLLLLVFYACDENHHETWNEQQIGAQVSRNSGVSVEARIKIHQVEPTKECPSRVVSKMQRGTWTMVTLRTCVQNSNFRTTTLCMWFWRVPLKNPESTVPQSSLHKTSAQRGVPTGPPTSTPQLSVGCERSTAPDEAFPQTSPKAWRGRTRERTPFASQTADTNIDPRKFPLHRSRAR